MTKIALITGGSRGLGKNMALHLAKKGRDIILTYHSRKDEAEAVVETITSMGRRAVAMQLDVGNSESFSQFARQVSDTLNKHWGRKDFDYLINNAGTGVFKDYLDITEEEFGRMVNEHIKGPFFLSQTLLPVVKNGGRILNVSSGLTRMAIPGFSAYAMMKAALETLSVYMAKELGSRGITVNTIAPGAIETDFGGGYVRDTPEVNEQLAAMTALGRVGLPDDVGGAVAAILDDDAGWINAQRIEVSGGQGI
ncbi:SDR family oxidoreductase [Marinobacter sp. 71-i]|uniref:SDR family oxidoreductase n=1 Tax=Marinobacter iranensis TaxID=2962607 RepID=A0ABT5YA16_9GAMM|nr:SDR family oxidoreductase [Marinobacter iranensis]MDF0750474.1 SDR family oxidoreductase [Marinobacter iranensis]